MKIIMTRRMRIRSFKDNKTDIPVVPTLEKAWILMNRRVKRLIDVKTLK